MESFRRETATADTDQIPSAASTPADGTAGRGSACSGGLCSVGLMRSLCPTCLVLGLVMLPFELLARWVRRLRGVRAAAAGSAGA